MERKKLWQLMRGSSGKDKCHRGLYLNFVTFSNYLWASFGWVLSFILVTRQVHILRSLSFINWVTVTYFTLAWFVVKTSWCLHILFYYVFGAEISVNNNVVRTFFECTRSSTMMDLLSGLKNFRQKRGVEMGCSVTCSPTRWIFKEHAHILIVSTSAVVHLICAFPHFHFR
jgi:hypothetical protein